MKISFLEKIASSLKTVFIIQAEAIDLRIPSIDTRELGKAALLPWLAALWATILIRPSFTGMSAAFGNGVGLPSNLHGRRLNRIRISLRKGFFERSVVPVDVIVKMNDSIFSNDDSAIYD